MNVMKIQSPAPRSLFRRLVMGFVLAAAIGGIAAPAMAEDWHDQRDRDHHERWDRDHHPRGYYVAPAPVYAPPPVVYAPPAPPAALSFVFPLNFH
jgi:hypothetical protein